MGKIKVVLWDIDGTLLNFLEAEKAAIRTCFSEFSLGQCTDEMLKVYSGINRVYWQKLERGEMTKPQILEGRFRDFFAHYGLNTECAAAFNSRYQVALGDTICFNPGGLEAMEALKGKVKQYAVTNGTKVAQKRKLANSGLDKLFDGVFISDELGVEKPNKGFFDKVWEAIGEYPGDEVLIVGDSLTSDMQGGINAGIKTCWFDVEGAQLPDGMQVDYRIDDLSKVPDICK